MLPVSVHGVCRKHHTKHDRFTTLTGEYADDVNRAYGDENGQFYRACEGVNVFGHILLRDHVHDDSRHEHVNVREMSFREYDDVRVLRALITEFQ